MVVAYVVILTPDMLVACTGQGVFYRLIVPGISERKKEILVAAESLQATAREKALLFAIASIETEAMQVDYPMCDNKINDACNIGIYKMNIGMIQKVIPNADLDKIHFDIGEATRVALRCMRTLQESSFLVMHRGGEGYFDGTIKPEAVAEYIKAIEILTLRYQQDENNQFDIENVNNVRMTIMVCPI